MRLAYIDHNLNAEPINYNCRYLVRNLEAAGVSVSSAETLDEFLSLYGQLEYYDGLIWHPGGKNQGRIKEVVGKLPKLPIAFVTNTPNDYLGNVPVLKYSSSKEFKEYFERRLMDARD